MNVRAILVGDGGRCIIGHSDSVLIPTEFGALGRKFHTEINDYFMIHTHTFNGLTVKTGDILCTRDGNDHNWFGRLWHLIGYLVPGRIDHAIMYIGPDGRCIEAGGKGVIEFVMPGNTWNATQEASTRLLQDTLIAVAYPLKNLKLSAEEEDRIRTGVANYCVEQLGKPYNVNFLDTVTEEAFYCSQLIYLAYREFGIDLGVTPVRMIVKTEAGEPDKPLLVLPTALLENSPHGLVRKMRWQRAARSQA